MLIQFVEDLFFSENIRAVSRNLSKWQTGETATKKNPKNTCAQNTQQKKRLNNTLNTKGKTDGQTLERLKRIIIVAFGKLVSLNL